MCPFPFGIPVKILCSLLFALVVLSGISRAEDTEPVRVRNTDMTITVTRPDQWSGSGFFPVKIDATNKGRRAHSFNLTFKGSHVGSMTVQPGHSQTFYFYIPSTLSAENDVYQSLTFTDLSSGMSTSTSFSAWTSRHIIPCHFKQLTSLIANIDSSRYSPEAFEFNPANWPADWRVYSSFTYMMIERDAYDQLDQAVQNAIDQWVIMGGNLVMLELNPSGSKAQKSDFSGWGAVYFLTGASDKDLHDQIKNLLDERVDSPYPKLPPSADSYIVRSPSGIMITLLIVFSIVIGPLCLFVWAPSARRQRLFILIPSISLGFSIVLLLLILLIDGTGGRGVRVAAIYLDPQKNSATILQQQICQTGLLLNNSFTLDPKVAFGSSNSNDSPRGSRFRSGSSLSGDWFPSRSSVTQQLAYVKPTRFRVTLVGWEGDRPVIQSTLPRDLTEFVYQDESRRFWRAATLPAGQKTTLVPETPAAPVKPGDFKGGKQYFNAYSDEATELAPMATLESIRWKDEKIFFYGPVTGE